jgi:hypothetical protein
VDRISYPKRIPTIPVVEMSVLIVSGDPTGSKAAREYGCMPKGEFHGLQN